MPQPPRRKLLLVGWDAADWKVIHPLLDSGRMPTLSALVTGGVAGTAATLQPVLSPMLWTSIATGKRPFKHGVLGFTEPAPDGRGVRPVTAFSRSTKAVWNILNQNGLRSNVVGWWPSHPAEPLHGAMVSNHYQYAVGPPERPWPLPPGAVHPRRLEATLAELRINPNELTLAELLAFVPRAAEIDQERDRRLATVMKVLAECASIHAAATWLMEHEPWDFMAVYYDAIDHFCHGFMQFHPPRREWIPERDFDLYAGVVDAAYCFHDLMLRRLIELAGPDTTVLLVSDHGFHPDHLRPSSIPSEPAGPAVEHRDFGIFVLNGPDIRKDELVHGVSILDVTPTVLTLFGLPIGSDMDGRPVTEAFEAPVVIERIPSWDAVAGDAGRHPEERRVDPFAAQEALDQLVALGYVEDADGEAERAVASTLVELQYNLARSYMDAGMYGEAAPVLRTLHGERPDEYRFGIQLAMCYRALDRIAELRALVENLNTRRESHRAEAQRQLEELAAEYRRRDAAAPSADAAVRTVTREEHARIRQLREAAHASPAALDYLLGFVSAAEGDHQVALEHLRAAGQVESGRPGLHVLIGEALLNLKRGDEAAGAFARALESDADQPHAHLGLCRVHLARNEYDEAVSEALTAVGLLYHFPMAHYYLGVGLLRLGDAHRAAQAFEAAIALNPHFREAHRRLALIYDVRLKDAARAQEHRRVAREIGAARRARRRAAAEASGAAAPPRAATYPALPSETLHRPRRVAPLQHGQVEPRVPITVVSGLPRSGTSMLMRMLDEGGLVPLTDALRTADADNPRGYREDERVKRLRQDATWLGEAVGKAVKIVAPLLPWLPNEYTYQVVFVERNIREVLASQRAMLERNGRTTAALDERLEREFERQVQRVKAWLAAQSNIAVLYLHYARIVGDPIASASTINEFLGGRLDEQRMAASVDGSLYRQRA